MRRKRSPRPGKRLGRGTSSPTTRFATSSVLKLVGDRIYFRDGIKTARSRSRASAIRLHEESGIDFSHQELRYDVRSNGSSAEGRIYYVGPRRAPSSARVTLDEEVVRPTVLREIGHSYPDTMTSPTC